MVHAADVERKLLTVVSMGLQARGALLTLNQIWGAKIPHLPSHGPMGRTPINSSSYETSPSDSMSKLPQVTEKTVDDEESLKPSRESLNRPLVLISAIFVGLAMTLIIILLLGFGLSEVGESDA